jgi:hypothetical protein
VGFKGERRRKSLEVSMRRTCKKDILWHVLQFAFSNPDGEGWGERVCRDEGRGESEVGDVFGFAAVAGAFVRTAGWD